MARPQPDGGWLCIIGNATRASTPSAWEKRRKGKGAYAALYPVCVFHALVSDGRAVGIICFKRRI